MDKKKRYGAGNGRPLVHKVDVESPEAIYFDGGFVVREFIDLGFCFSPVVILFPILDQTFDVRQWSSIVPASFVELVRKSGVCELLRKSLEVLIRDGHIERLE